MKNPEIDRIIRNALREDAATRDITTRAIARPGAVATAVFRAKEDGVVAGLHVASRVFAILDRTCAFRARVKDGGSVKAGAVIARLRGPVRALLAGERTALNLLQRMSGIATVTRRYVRAVAGSQVMILDTRKTAPGLRVLDKYAVRAGGATNHRMNLSDLAMIKDNHIRAAGGIRRAVQAVRSRRPKARLEVEASTLDEVRQALDARVDIIMLDNMKRADMRRAVALAKGKAKIEASGSMDLKKARAAARTGVDLISVGRLTHSAPALDISMKLV